MISANANLMIGGNSNFDPEQSILEVNGDPAGVLVRENNGFVFHAVAEWALPLDHTRYSGMHLAERAILSTAPSFKVARFNQ